MGSANQAGSNPQAGFSAALDQLWIKFLPEIEERLALLESAAAAAQDGSLTPQVQHSAQAAAHKLAGVLGSFGLSEGTAPARETERIYSLTEAPSRECASLLATLAAALHSVVDGRKQPHPPAQ